MEVLDKQISTIIYLVILSVLSLYTECHTESNVPDLKPNLNKPEQIHLSLGSKSNDIIVMWSTKDNEEVYVEYGNDLNDFSSFMKIMSQKVELSNYSENAARFIHRVELLDLEIGKIYWYCIICSISGIRSEKFTFKVPHNKSQMHKFVVIADVGVETKSLQFLMHEILNGGYGVVFHVGDIAYNLHTDGGRVGDVFMNKIGNFTARVPYLTTPGDHEEMYQFYHYRNRFSMPKAPWPMTTDALWYSINIGFTHFISINTQLIPPANLSDLQFQWLKNDLRAANKKRSTIPWIIVMGHRPFYCTKSVMKQLCDKEDSPLREQFEDLFFEQGVDLYISGHKHCYERSWPMYRGRVFQTDNINPMAPIYIITGTTGYQYLVDKQFSRPFWLANAVSDGEKELYARLSVVNATHLIWSMHAIMSNEEIEKVQIIQNQHGSFGKPGASAFEKIKLVSNRHVGLPPEPFVLVDIQADTNSRRVILYAAVLVMSLILIIFYRNTRLRNVLRIKW